MAKSAIGFVSRFFAAQNKNGKMIIENCVLNRHTTRTGIDGIFTIFFFTSFAVWLCLNHSKTRERRVRFNECLANATSNTRWTMNAAALCDARACVFVCVCECVRAHTRARAHASMPMCALRFRRFACVANGTQAPMRTHTHTHTSAARERRQCAGRWYLCVHFYLSR